ncbi:ubiquinone biosynthesis protein COQ7 [uncultured Adlercreutzia sp.]|uniref:ferritin family protein n=1 Tax=uncultured Adlercreutzia sp. TaxID=875803 RepID=UPI0026F3F070|nr:ubiquinone biosynthesis protein COQ7 [uncultured Adlercreutzia sp.]
MAILSNPFVMEVPRKLTDEELINAIRQDIVGELEAIHEYDAHIQATDNEDAKKVLADIRDEEREHMGELMELLERLAPDERTLNDEGREEVREMLDKKPAKKSAKK